MAKISRRDFLKGTAAGAMGLAAMGLAPTVEVKAEVAPQLTPQQAVAKLNPQDYDYRSKDTDMAAIFPAGTLAASSSTTAWSSLPRALTPRTTRKS